ncbi:unnamed protein product [Phytophthora lilii]|uniref:arabinogalactan endo-beta-1,4-galactanase n=1 Tax=Phytophthora lilii TaxID=2077276 RepID=A0A9W6WS36_9STRA|nr:unnamed protein product [Phytophthora lilii]
MALLAFAVVQASASCYSKQQYFLRACVANMLDVASALTKGHDLSSVGLMETEQGANWISTSGNTTTIEAILGAGGMDTVRLRNFATLWKAARKGVTDAVSDGTTQPKVMIHLDNGWKYETVSWFFKGLFAEGTVTHRRRGHVLLLVLPILQHGGDDDVLTSSLTKLANTYSKQIYVAETDWPTECSKVTVSANYAVSAVGQTQWVDAIKSVLEGLPEAWVPAFSTGSPPT